MWYLMRNIVVIEVATDKSKSEKPVKQGGPKGDAAEDLRFA